MMPPVPTGPGCLVSGSGGYLGSRVKAALQQRGWTVKELTRRPAPGSPAIRFRLGSEVPAVDLTGAKALVHCAYDFEQVSWSDIRAINVDGSEKLLRAAQQAGVEHLVLISSISAFEGCRSLYGKAKLEIEKIAHSLGAVVIRPGLIWGQRPGAMFGRLVNQVERSSVLPLFGGGSQIQYLVHDVDLSEVICRAAAGTISLPGAPITIAHEQPWTFRQILEEIGRAKGKRLRFVPAPWRLLWGTIKMAELCHLRLAFRSDSLLSLMYQNPDPAFGPKQQLGIACRAFQLA